MSESAIHLEKSRSSNVEDRIEAGEYLARNLDPTYAESLCTLLRDKENIGVTRFTAEALLEHPTAEGISILSRAFAECDPNDDFQNRQTILDAVGGASVENGAALKSFFVEGSHSLDETTKIGADQILNWKSDW